MTAQSAWVRNSDDALTAEVIVAGAWPAGATAARTLAAAGVQTLLVEKTAFPRRGEVSYSALRRTVICRFPATALRLARGRLAVSSARAS